MLFSYNDLRVNVIHITPPHLRGLFLHRLIITLIIFTLSCWILFYNNPTMLRFSEEAFRDWAVRGAANSSSAVEQRAVVVDIDEDSILKLGPWPWERSVIAALIENLVADYEAKAVAVDIVFPEQGDATGDEKIAVLAQFAPVVLSQVFDYSNRPSRLAVGTLAGTVHLPNLPNAAEATGYIANHRGLGSSPHVGNIGFAPDPDGNLRKANLVTLFDTAQYPSLALVTAQLTHNFHLDPIKFKASIRIPFDKPLSAYTVIPAHRVLERSAPKELIQGKAIFIGSSSLGLGDRVATPLSPQTSGVFAHVALYSGLLEGYPDGLQRSAVGNWLALGWITLMCSLAFSRFNTQPASHNILMILVAAALWFGVATWLAVNFVEANLSAPIVTLLGLILLLVPYDWQTSQNKSKFLTKTLRHHISAALAQEVIESGVTNPLAPKFETITVLVVDVENFTGNTADLPTEEVAILTKDLLNLIGNEVLSTRGTIDRFTGDGAVAFWGAPLPMHNHADLAVTAGLGILQAVQKYSAVQAKAGKPTIRVRIGIDTGEVVVGDFGSEDRAIYTALGQCMGRAARFEELCKIYTTDLIVGSNTVKSSTKYGFEQIDSPILRGLREQVDIFRIKTPAAE